MMIRFPDPRRRGKARWTAAGAVVAVAAVVLVLIAVVTSGTEPDRPPAGATPSGTGGQQPPATASDASTQTAAPPELLLPEPARGRRALDLLGDDLPEAARLNGMAPEELRALVLSDSTVWLDRTGRVYFVDDISAPAGTDDAGGADPFTGQPHPDERAEGSDPAQAGSTAGPTTEPTVELTTEPTMARTEPTTDATAESTEPTTAATFEGAAATADAFALHSLPGAQRTIFLDFDGADVSGTSWNSQAGVRSGFHTGWDPARNGPGFSADELDRVTSVWARVAEDYAPFGVNVTTRDPGRAAIERSGSLDQVFGTRVLVSASVEASDAICASRCGGVAYLRAFAVTTQHGSLQPAWVFPHALLHDTKAVAEAATHEAGHNLGLSHDGQGTDAYYAGQGIWAPIMGAGYDRPLVQWSRGDYAGSTNQEDDLAVMVQNGAPRRADEAGGLPLTAAGSLPPGPAVIGAPGDRDTYALTGCAGSLIATATPASVSPNLDISLEVLDVAGTVLVRGDPPVTGLDRDVVTGMGATVIAEAPQDTLFVRVSGEGTVRAYSDYGSLGSYTLQVEGCGNSKRTAEEPTTTASPSATPPTTTPPTTTPPTTPSAGTPSPETTPPEPTTSLPPQTVHPTVAPNAGPTSPSTPGAGPRERPAAPAMGRVSPGSAGTPATLRVRWRQPATVEPVITAYQLRGERIDAAGRVVARKTWTLRVPLSRTTATLRLPAARWRFVVRAGNDVGFGPWSDRSRIVRAR